MLAFWLYSTPRFQARGVSMHACVGDSATALHSRQVYSIDPLGCKVCVLCLRSAAACLSPTFAKSLVVTCDVRDDAGCRMSTITAGVTFSRHAAIDTCSRHAGILLLADFASESHRSSESGNTWVYLCCFVHSHVTDWYTCGTRLVHIWSWDRRLPCQKERRRSM